MGRRPNKNKPIAKKIKKTALDLMAAGHSASEVAKILLDDFDINIRSNTIAVWAQRNPKSLIPGVVTKTAADGVAKELSKDMQQHADTISAYLKEFVKSNISLFADAWTLINGRVKAGTVGNGDLIRCMELTSKNLFELSKTQAQQSPAGGNGINIIIPGEILNYNAPLSERTINVPGDDDA